MLAWLLKVRSSLEEAEEKMRGVTRLHVTWRIEIGQTSPEITANQWARDAIAICHTALHWRHPQILAVIQDRIAAGGFEPWYFRHPCYAPRRLTQLNLWGGYDSCRSLYYGAENTIETMYRSLHDEQVASDLFGDTRMSDTRYWQRRAAGVIW